MAAKKTTKTPVKPVKPVKKATSPARAPALRGVALIEAAIASAREKRLIPEPEPVPAALLDRLTLPNDEPLPVSLRALLAFDASWLRMGIDAEDAVLEALDLEDLVEREFGEEMVTDFEEAIEILSDDCIPIGEGADSRRFLYVGNPDSAGEYPVITVDTDDSPWIGGFVPFDVWVAQHLGALPEESTYGWVPEVYESAVKELARRNGDGRTSFISGPIGDEDAGG